MTTAHHDIPELDRGGLRKFAFMMAVVVAVLFGLLFPWVFGKGIPTWPWVFAAIFTGWGAAAPDTLGPVYRGWMRFGLLLNRVMTPLILGIVFFLVVTPMAVIMKIIKRDAMRRDIDKEAQSYRIESEPQAREQVERPF